LASLFIISKKKYLVYIRENQEMSHQKVLLEQLATKIGILNNSKTYQKSRKVDNFSKFLQKILALGEPNSLDFPALVYLG